MFHRVSLTRNQRMRECTRCRKRYKKVEDLISCKHVLYVDLRVEIIVKPEKYDNLQLDFNFTTLLKGK